MNGFWLLSGCPLTSNEWFWLFLGHPLTSTGQVALRRVYTS